MSKAPAWMILVALVSLVSGCSEQSTGQSDGSIDVPLTDIGTSDATSNAATPDLRSDGTDTGLCTHPSVTPSCVDGWCAIPAGCFKMGSPDSEPCRKPELDEVQHQVTLTHDFEIQRTEVTQQQFRTLMGFDPSLFKDCGDDCPVESVSWHGAAAYSNALSTQQGLTPCYEDQGTATPCDNAHHVCRSEHPNAGCMNGVCVRYDVVAAYDAKIIYQCPGYRLPTEAEWEYAYRAGTTTAFYSGSNDPVRCSSCTKEDGNAATIGWYCGNTRRTEPRPVGQKQQNAWGLLDMAGNVSEWCHDRYHHLDATTAIDPWGAAQGDSRVSRGGSYSYSASWMRAACRSRGAPGVRAGVFGFRLARTK